MWLIFPRQAPDIAESKLILAYADLVADPRCSGAQAPSAGLSCRVQLFDAAACSLETLATALPVQLTEANPWEAVIYLAGNHSFEIDMGQPVTVERVRGKALVVHDYDGLPLACALLPDEVQGGIDLTGLLDSAVAFGPSPVLLLGAVAILGSLV